jgi:hypothetical protein
MNSTTCKYYNAMLFSSLQLLVITWPMHRYVKWEEHKRHSHLYPEMMYRAMDCMNLQVWQLLIGCGQAEGCEER